MRPGITASNRWHFPTPRVERLDSDLQVWLFDLPGQHVAAFDLVIPMPLVLEPEPIEGVASIAVSAIDEGTTTHPDGRITELLELEGAVLHGAAAHGHTRLGGDAPAHRLERLAQLLVDVLSNPAYAPGDVTHHVALQVAAHASREASPVAATRRLFRRALYGADTREGRPASGSPETLEAITPEEVRDWHRLRWLPDGATFVLAGDLSGTDVDAALATLSGWRGEGRAVRGDDPATRPPTVVIHDQPDAVQATVQLGCPLPGRRHPRWEALRLAGHAMAGAFSSRLNVELRERRGYTYGVQGGCSTLGSQGRFGVASSFRTEVAAEAIGLILEALRLQEGFAAEEISDAARFLVGVAPLANETAADITRQAAVLAAADEEPGYVNEHLAALLVPDQADATEAFAEHIRPERMTIAVGGPADALIPQLRELGLDPEVTDRPARPVPAP